MSKFIETRDGKTITGPRDYTGTMPDFSDIGITTVDITGLTPIPAEHWTYNGTSFTATVVPNVSLEALRIERNSFLSGSDWRDLPSYPGSDQEAWREYRQALRDLPDGYVPSEEPVFPEPPN